MSHPSAPAPRNLLIPRLAAVCGGVMLAAAGGALWASEGAKVFVESAFSAVIACF